MFQCEAKTTPENTQVHTKCSQLYIKKRMWSSMMDETKNHPNIKWLWHASYLSQLELYDHNGYKVSGLDKLHHWRSLSFSFLLDFKYCYVYIKSFIMWRGDCWVAIWLGASIIHAFWHLRNICLLSPQREVKLQQSCLSLRWERKRKHPISLSLCARLRGCKYDVCACVRICVRIFTCKCAFCIYFAWGTQKRRKRASDRTQE